MFYAHFVLSKKGPLARIWLAAHWDRKLTKAHVFETNIGSSVEAIIEPRVKLALRTSGHLLLGVVRIYSRKAKYLLADCNEAFVKIRMAFRPGVVDLPEEGREAAVAAITLPETFHDFETAMADLSDIDVHAQFSVNQSRPEEITMREDQIGNITLVGDDGFGDMGFDGGNIIHDAHMDDTLYVKSAPAAAAAGEDGAKKADEAMDMDFGPAAAAAAAGDGFGAAIDDFEEPAGIEDDDDSDDGGDFGGGVDHELFGENFVGEAGGLFEEPPMPEVPPADGEQMSAVQKDDVAKTSAGDHEEEEAGVDALPEQSTVPDQTTLIPDEARAFALEPIDVTNIGTERKTKRKRKLVIDELKGIASETMKLQLSDTSDIISTLDLAPPTKKLMHWKETGGVEKLFALPGRAIVSARLSKLFSNRLVTRSQRDDDHALGQLEQERERLEAQQRQQAQQAQQVLEQKQLLEQKQQQQQQQRQQLQLSQMAPPNVELMRDAEESRISTDAAGAAPLDDASLVEEPSRIEHEPPSFADSSVASLRAPTPAAAAPQDDSFTLAPLTPYRRGSTDDEDADNLFDEMPAVDHESSSDQQVQSEEEEDEDLRWSKRTQVMMSTLQHELGGAESAASFRALTARATRKQAASKFYTLLVLKKLEGINLSQAEPFGDISITRGPKFGVVC